jgi:hypothetical protein
MATTYLSRTSGTPTDSKKTTLSVWLKRSGLGTGTFFGGGADSNNMTFINFNPNGKIFLQSSSSGSNTLVFVTTQVFRDTSAWYHIVVAIDTTQGTASNRVKLYVNGVQVTAFDTETQPSQNLELEWNKSGKTLEIGKYLFQSTYSLYDGSMSYVSFVDGTQELPTVFGETDSTTGEWKIKTDITPSVAWGNNGFLILKNGNSLTDESSNSNNFTLGGGTLTNTEDCPSNVFATLNSLATSSYGTLIQGNNTVKGNISTNSAETFSTLSTNNDGKYYYEIKCTGVNGVDNPNFGFIQTARGFRLQNGEPGLGGATNGSLDIRVQPNGKTYNNGAASGSAVISTYTAGDILGFAIDSDNGAFYVAKNGTWQTSGNPESGASRTGAIKTWSPTDSKVTDGQSVCIGVYNTAAIADANFGNGYFGTTAVSSAGTNASGNGIFEYDVPTGYTALSTKGLNL